MGGKRFACHLNLSMICARVAAELGADSAGIALVHGNSVRYVAGFGFEWERVPPVSVGESLIGATVARGSTFASADIRIDTRCTRSREAQEMGIAALMASPLKDGVDGVFGVMAVHRRDLFDWVGSQVRLLESLASIVGTFLLAGQHCAPSGGYRPNQPAVGPSAKRLVLCSEATVSAFQKAERVARSSCSLLITGERGTGKDVLARYIHDHSGRTGKFLAFNCASAPDELFEAELFGHARGAFTGAVAERDGLLMTAEGGTVLLDELAELSPRAQAKLLSVLENKEIKRVGENVFRRVDVRIIGATNRDIVPGRGSDFLNDLYDRIAEYVIPVPPLRDRPEDLRSFVQRFLAEIAEELAHPIAGISDGALERLKGHSWPGNVRELKRVLWAAVMDTPPGHLLPSSAVQFDLPSAMSGGTEARTSTVGPDTKPVSRIPGTADSNAPIPVGGQSDDQLRALYDRHHRNVSRVAKDMGITRQAAQKKLRKLGLR